MQLECLSIKFNGPTEIRVCTMSETSGEFHSGKVDVVHAPPAMVFFFLFLFVSLFATFLLTVYVTFGPGRDERRLKRLV